MSKRLQVLMDEKEYKEVKAIAKRSGLSVGEWVRRALRAAASEVSDASPSLKIKALDDAMSFSFPSGDIDQMLSEIEQGYSEEQ